MAADANTRGAAPLFRVPRRTWIVDGRRALSPQRRPLPLSPALSLSLCLSVRSANGASPRARVEERAKKKTMDGACREKRGLVAPLGEKEEKERARKARCVRACVSFSVKRLPCLFLCSASCPCPDFGGRGRAVALMAVNARAHMCTHAHARTHPPTPHPPTHSGADARVELVVDRRTALFGADRDQHAHEADAHG